MDEIINLTTHMSQTIEDFRSLFKPEKKKETFDVTDTINHTLELMDGLLKGINVKFHSNGAVFHYGYKNELIQVLLILFSNAIEALELNKVEFKLIEILIENRENEEILIAIEDNAGGIKEEYLENIFDPYFTTKSKTGGTGLGLYVAKIIIEQNMHGVLSVYNTQNGAKFTIRLRREDVKNT